MSPVIMMMPQKWFLRAMRLFVALSIVCFGVCSGLLTGTPRADASDDWSSLPIVVEQGPIVVRAQAGMRALAAEVAGEAPGYLDAIYADLEGMNRPARVVIQLVREADDLARVAPAGRGAPAWASGVAYPDLGVVSVATRRGPQLIDVNRVVAHELAHLALGAALGESHGEAHGEAHDQKRAGHVPRWLHEGFAYLHSSDWSAARAQTLTGMVWSGDIIPLAELDRRFPARDSEVDRAYAQSYDFTAFLARRGRYPDEHDDGDRWPLRYFLAELAAGQTLHSAAWKAYGASLDELFDEWRADLRDRYLLMPAGLFGLAVWALAALLLILGFMRKRRLSRRTLERWEREEKARAATSSPDTFDHLRLLS